MQLRFATGGAAEGWAEVQMSASPFLVSSADSVVHDMAHHPGTLARYVVVKDGQVLGLTRVRAHRPGEVRAMVQVRADQQGRGVGRLLLDQVLRVADGRSVAGVVNGDEHSVAFSDHWGFVREGGRGLATLVKAHSLAAMAAAGITRCSTGNDKTNSAMLAVNQRLGFGPLTSVWSARRPSMDGPVPTP